jgi:anti-sigma-K factor RskA
MTERRDDDSSAFEEALDLLDGDHAGASRDVEAKHLEPAVAMLRSIPREAWKAPLPPRLDLEAVTGRKQAEAPRVLRESSRRRRAGFFGSWPRLVAGGMAVAAMVGVGVVLGLVLGGGSSTEFTPSERLVLSGIGEEVPSGASGEVLIADRGSEPLELDVNGLKPNEGKEFYEFWLLGKKGELVSLGSFRVDQEGSSRVRLPLPVDPADYGYFDVSIEKEDGSPEHSGKSVLRGLTKA